MPHISLKISEGLYQQLKLKAKEMGDLKISDAVRILLRSAIENQAPKDDKKLLKRALHYAITTYYLVQEQLLDSSKKGSSLNDAAHQKADLVIESLLKKK